ncbi:tyrosine-type recombinase/integrase [Enterobacteriaceae bacterium H20N1]|uniref:Tyrosine-type recombinase/integrase n=1 Tax=Dryocola boscaweniae TaxID=2925397 RepID=A0A9X2W6X1_9ENTR|nr:tyrosine-type recombinase/integrase [Dryocola boscaweniae]MCT4701203.1 tyrosine-type recombinase/integrase [Dryocola boscaweniae]MCT4718292.1 tyrosine-type recombinase/integrase [Dryocola boscaweniae]
MKNWLTRYEAIVNFRHQRGEIKLKTLSDYQRLISFCSDVWGSRLLTSITVSEITEAIHSKAIETPHSARRLRINLSNLFIEAQRESFVPLGHNPALVSKFPRTSVKTVRLSLDEWLRIFRCAKYRAPEYFQNAMLLALITAQRPSDIVKMKKLDIKDGFLHIEQAKTGEKIALPLSLKLDAISTSLSEVVDMCSSSGPLLQCARRKRVNTWSISRWFKICREQAGISIEEDRTPPPFREQRSLAERLYRAQGIDTRTLLGHKYQQMTDQYNDTRGKEYRKLLLP